MKHIVLSLAATFFVGCAAAPPPVKIASHLIGHGLLKKAKDEVQTPDAPPSSSPQ